MITALQQSDPMQLAIEKTADISSCGLYRYLLTRRWADGDMLGFVMLNPSTADASIDDPTIRRCMGFARRENLSGIIVANIFGFRAIQPVQLLKAADPIGPGNDEAIRTVAKTAKLIVCAWGAGRSGRFSYAGRRAVGILKAEGAALVCLGRTTNREPRHPLYIRADQPLEPFP